MPPKQRKLDETKNKNAPKITWLLTIFAEHGIMAHIPWWLSRIALSNDIGFNKNNYAVREWAFEYIIVQYKTLMESGTYFLELFNYMLNYNQTPIVKLFFTL